MSLLMRCKNNFILVPFVVLFNFSFAQCPFNLLVNPTNETACGSCNGQAQAFVIGGTGPFTYLWNDPPPQQTTSAATGLCSGNFTVTVTDGLGCKKTSQVTIACPGVCNLTVFSTSQNETSCGACDGQAGVFVTNGTSPYTYLWNDTNAQTNSGATGLCSGVYTVTITDAAACTDTAVRVVGCPGACTMSLSTVTTAESTCGACDGQAGVMPSAGNPPYTFLWDDADSQSTQLASGLCSGTYTVIVTDTAGCTDTASATVTCSSCSFSVAVTPQNESLCGACDGEAYAGVSNGTGPFSFLWNNGQTAITDTALCRGTYTVWVTDSFGCTDSASTVIGCPGCMISLNTNSTGETGCNSCDGTAGVTVNSGVPSYTYLWNSSPAQSSPVATGLCPGTYIVSVTDAGGCSDTATASVNAFISTLSLAPASTDETTCGSCNGTVSAGASGGTPPYSYFWGTSPIQTSSAATGLCPGRYQVSVTDGGGCSDTASAMVAPYLSTLSVMASSIDASNCDSCDGVAIISATGGITPYTYSWDNMPAQTDSAASDLCVGTYSVTATDAGGCSTDISVTVGCPALCSLILNAASTNAICSDSSGTATITVSGGASPYSYLWDAAAGWQTGSTATGLPAGTYRVTVNDSIGCTDSLQVPVANTNGPEVSMQNSGNVSCNGGNDGSASVIVSGGTPPYLYEWDDADNQTTSSATGLAAGTYNVSFTDANNCSGNASVTVTEPASLSINLTGNNPVCNGDCNGDATAAVGGGTAPYSYQWDDSLNQTYYTATGLCAGNFSITITDSNSCFISGIITLNDPPAVVISVSTTDASCGMNNGNAMVNATGGTPSYTYSWSTGAGNDTLQDIPAGTYMVTVTDFNGCIKISSGTVNNIGGPSVVISSTTNITCYGNSDGGASATATGGAAPYAYLWSDGQTTSLATGLGAGVYYVSITDTIGCIGSSSVTISQPPLLNTAIVSATNVTCNGLCNGQAVISATGGVTPYAYLWTNGQTAASPNGLCSGIFSVTITDNNGCTVTDAVVITEPDVLAYTVSATNPACPGTCDGSAAISVSGGLAPYSFQWDDPAQQTGSEATGLCEGIYFIALTDQNGCTQTASVAINSPAGMILAISSSDASCGNNDGSASVTVTGGLSPYSYYWSGGSTGSTADSLEAGNYSVTVTDGGGCSDTVVVSINDIGGPSVIITVISNVTCNGGDDGSASAAASGGTGSYNYTWSNGASQSSVSNLLPAIYFITVTDSSGCKGVASITITEPSAINGFIVSQTGTSCKNACDGTAAVTQNGGTPPYSWLWNTLPLQTDANATGLCAGNYLVTISDTNGCSIVKNLTITEPDLMTSVLTTTNPSCPGICDGIAAVSVAGGTIPYSYQWDDPAFQTNSAATGLCPDTFNVSITDNKGCTAIITSVVNEVAGGMSLSMTSTDATCLMEDGSATANVAGGIPPYSFQWDDQLLQTTQTATGLSAGGYSLTVTDGIGCTITGFALIGNPGAPIVIASITNVSCYGGNNGTATAMASGGTPPYTYSWNDSIQQTASTATGLAPGTYFVIVSDSSGCSAAAVAAISEPQPLNAAITSVTNAACSNSCDGVSSVSVSGGAPPYSFLWNTSPPQTGAQATSLCAGNYSVAVTDNNGCADSSAVTITAPPPDFLIIGNVRCRLQ